MSMLSSLRRFVSASPRRRLVQNGTDLFVTGNTEDRSGLPATTTSRTISTPISDTHIRTTYNTATYNSTISKSTITLSSDCATRFGHTTSSTISFGDTKQPQPRSFKWICLHAKTYFSHLVESEYGCNPKI